MSAAPTVHSTEHDRVRVLTLDRPRVRNALDTATTAALLDAVDAACRDDAVEALVITGSEGHLSGGADLREPLDHDGAVRRMELLVALFEAVSTCPLPTIAAIHGACVGGGLELAASCDLRVADPTAVLRYPGAGLGIPIGPARLVALVGLGTATDLLLTGRRFTADEALAIGLVQRMAPAGGAVDLAVQVADEVLAGDLATVAYLRRQLRAFTGIDDRTRAEQDALVALARADGDYHAVTHDDPKRAGTWGTRGATGT